MEEGDEEPGDEEEEESSELTSGYAHHLQDVWIAGRPRTLLTMVLEAEPLVGGAILLEPMPEAGGRKLG